MRKKAKEARKSKIQEENEALPEPGLAQDPVLAGILVAMYERDGKILQQLQKIQANSWLR